MPKPLVLCLDDESDLLYLHRLVLERGGYDVLTAREAATALDLLDKNPVDLVITDHVMPGGSGEEFIAQIRRTRPNVPILLLTGMLPSAIGQTAADEVMQKTDGTEELLRRVAALTKKK